MPLRSDLIGAYQLLLLSGNYCIVNSANRDRKEDTKPKNLVQGTVKTRILDIGGISEDISIDAPILIGGGSRVDGRQLLNTKITEALNPGNTILPVLSSAEINISEQGANVRVGLKSDGRPSSVAFTLTGLGADNMPILGGGTAPLDPYNAEGETRVARFFDFRIALYGYLYFIISARIQIEVTIVPKYFIPGKDGSYTAGSTSDPLPASVPGGNPLNSTDVNNPWNFGTQFAWLAVSGIHVSGSGSAGVALSNGSTDPFLSEGQSVNVSFATDGTAYELTNQPPGQTVAANTALDIEVWNPNFVKNVPGNPDGDNGSHWQPIFALANGTGAPLIDLSKGVINKSDFKLTPDMMTVDFGFTCWVK